MSEVDSSGVISRCDDLDCVPGKVEPKFRKRAERGGWEVELTLLLRVDCVGNLVLVRRFTTQVDNQRATERSRKAARVQRGSFDESYESVDVLGG